MMYRTVIELMHVCHIHMLQHIMFQSDLYTAAGCCYK
jgi:hypothetical protein